MPYSVRFRARLKLCLEAKLGGFEIAYGIFTGAAQIVMRSLAKGLLHRECAAGSRAQETRQQ
jgi:hypothetical protein